MGIHYIDGIRLYRSLSAGIQRVISRQDYLNKINVFPVPDSDTGTNMAFTLSMIEDGISENIHSDITNMSASIADVALDSARGNSGAILAQFLVGFSEGLPSLTKITSKDFAKAALAAKNYSYEALLKPKEGTILTVITDWADELHKLSDQVHDFTSLMAKALERAKASLADTPKQLAVLAKAGVVDAGAQGFVDLLEGIQEFIEKGVFTRTELERVEDPSSAGTVEFSENYRYCTECVVVNDPVDRVGLKEAIMDYGDSIVIAGTKTKAKIHIHTDDPKKIVTLCGQFGTISGEKADDMFRQQADARSKHKEIVIVVDSGCDLSEELMEKYNIHMVPVRLSFGEKHYVDKVTMSSEDFWNELATNPIHPKTSQPTPGDFRRQYQFLASHYESAISIHLPAKLSGTMQSALSATKSVKDFPTHVVDSYSGSIGAGLIAIRVSEAVEEGKSFDDIIAIVNQAIQNTTIYIGLDSLDNVVKGGRVSPSKKRVADLLHINPILTFNENGVESVGITLGKKNKVKKLIQFVEKRLPKDVPYRVGISHALHPDGAREVFEHFKPIVGEERIYQSEIGPALGVHSGPKGLVIAIQTLEDS